MHAFILAILLTSQPYPTYQFTIGFKDMDSCRAGIAYIANKMDASKRAEFVDQADCLEQWISPEKLKNLSENEKYGKLLPTGKPEKQM